MIEVTHYSDPGCPWAYSAAPALTALRWRLPSTAEVAAVMAEHLTAPTSRRPSTR